MKKGTKKIMIILAALIVSILACVMIKYIISSQKYPKVPIGNNLYSYGQSKQLIKTSEYSSAKEAYDASMKKYNSKFDDIKNIIINDEDDKSNIILYQNENSIESIQFIKTTSSNKSAYVYTGGNSIIFWNQNIKLDKDIETTVRSDLSLFISAEAEWLNLKEEYGRMPVWGVTDDNAVYTMSIADQKPDLINEIEYNGQVFYLWYYKNLETDSNARDISVSFE